MPENKPFIPGPQVNVGSDWERGARLALAAAGIKNQKEQNEWMQKLYASQLQTEAMKRQQLGTQMQREAMPVSQLLSQGPQTFGDIGYYSALVKGLQPPEYKPTSEAAAIRLKEAGRRPSSETESSLLSLPETDPRRQQFISGKKELVGAGGKNQTVEQLTARALQGDVEARSILNDMEKRQTRVAAAGAAARTEAVQKTYSPKAKQIVDQIMAGKIPPDITGFGMGPLRVEMLSYAAEKGYDLSQATLDWQAEKKYVASLNSPQQTRIRQNIKFAYETLDKVEDLNKKWDRGGYPPLNRAILKAAKTGVLGKDALTIATQLETQIADLTGDLGQIYMGGNTPTDHSLALAAKNLSAEWTYEQLRENIELVKYNLGMRTHSLRVGAAGLSSGSPYEKGTEAPKTTISPKIIQGKGWKATPVD